LFHQIFATKNHHYKEIKNLHLRGSKYKKDEGNNETPKKGIYVV